MAKSALKDRLFKFEFIVEKSKNVKINVVVYDGAEEDPELTQSLAKLLKGLQHGLMNDGIIYNIRKEIGDSQTNKVIAEYQKIAKAIEKIHGEKPFVRPLDVF